jgi:hypothetical protein
VWPPRFRGTAAPSWVERAARPAAADPRGARLVSVSRCSPFRRLTTAMKNRPGFSRCGVSRDGDHFAPALISLRSMMFTRRTRRTRRTRSGLPGPAWLEHQQALPRDRRQRPADRAPDQSASRPSPLWTPDTPFQRRKPWPWISPKAQRARGCAESTRHLCNSGAIGPEFGGQARVLAPELPTAFHIVPERQPHPRALCTLRSRQVRAGRLGAPAEVRAPVRWRRVPVRSNARPVRRPGARRSGNAPAPPRD